MSSFACREARPAPDRDAVVRSEWAREQFLAAMGLATSAVTVVTTDGPAGRYGQTVSAMCSVSADPPTVLVCVNRTSPLCAAIVINECFAVNLLAATQVRVSDMFAGRTPSGAVPYDFSCASWTVRVTGSPILRGAIAIVDSRLSQAVEVATHVVLIGAVAASSSWPSESLAYRARMYGRHSPFEPDGVSERVSDEVLREMAEKRGANS